MSDIKSQLHTLSLANKNEKYLEAYSDKEQKLQFHNECINYLHRYLDNLPTVTLNDLKEHATNHSSFKYWYLSIHCSNSMYVKNQQLHNAHMTINGTSFAISDNVNVNQIMRIDFNHSYNSVSAEYITRYLQQKNYIEGLGHPTYNKHTYKNSYNNPETYYSLCYSWSIFDD